MAKTITIVDDLDGSTPAETIQFGLNGAWLEIDLSQKNYKKLEDALKPFLERLADRRVPSLSARAHPGVAEPTRRWSGDSPTGAGSVPRKQPTSVSTSMRFRSCVVIAVSRCSTQLTRRSRSATVCRASSILHDPHL
jgi:hypothetical protein